MLQNLITRSYCARTESRAMEETEGQTPELRPNELASRSNGRNGRRQETEPEKRETEHSGFGVSEEGQIPDHEVSDADSNARENLKQQQRVSDVEMQRRSHETESRLWRTARIPDWRASESKRMLNERTQGRHEHVLSSAYPVRPGEEYCLFYLRYRLCGYGSECRFNHPPLHEFPYRIGRKLDCKVGGACTRSSDCKFYHREERDGAEPVLFNVPSLPMPQGRTPDLRPNDSGRRYETESRSCPEKREKEDFGFGINEVGQFRDHHYSDEDAQGILLQQRPRDVEMRKRSRSPDWRASESRERFEDRCQRRHEMELALFKRAREVRMNCINARENLQKQRQGNIERQRREVQENLQQQRFQDMPENHNIDAQQNLQKQRNIEKERREARLRLHQIRPTVVFDEWSRAIELMKEFGFTDFEGSFLGRQEIYI